MKLLRTLALAAFLPGAALAGAPMETVQPVDGLGVPLGTATNPLYVSGGSGGGGGTVTQGPAATDTSGNRWPVLSYQGGTWSVGLTGTLPAFASTPTFNLGTLNGAATASNQSTEIAALGAPADTAYAGSGSASIISALKGVYNALLAPTPAGANNVGRVGVDAASVAGGLTTVSRIVSSAASTNPTVAKASAGRAYKVTGFNAATSVRWLHFYNTASSPTVGTTAVFFALPLPPGAFAFDAQDIGYTFSTGVAYGLSTGASDTDATALAAGDVLNLNVWVQ